MVNKYDAVITDENTLRNFLRRYGEGYLSKDHEFSLAIYIKRLFELEWGYECCLAFVTTHPTKLKTGTFVNVDVEEIRKVFREEATLDTPIDFLLLGGTPTKHSDEGYAFQLKRFGMGIKKNFKDKMLRYLQEEIPKKYGDCGEVALILAVELDEKLDQAETKELEGNFDFDFLRSKLNFKKYPFKKILLLGLGKNSLHLTEVWPGKQQLIASREQVGLKK